MHINSVQILWCERKSYPHPRLITMSVFIIVYYGGLLSKNGRRRKRYILQQGKLRNQAKVRYHGSLYTEVTLLVGFILNYAERF